MRGNHVRWRGGDVPSLGARSKEECCDACNADARCRAFTFVDDGTLQCYLKAVIEPKVLAANRISGVEGQPLLPRLATHSLAGLRSAPLAMPEEDLSPIDPNILNELDPVRAR